MNGKQCDCKLLQRMHLIIETLIKTGAAWELYDRMDTLDSILEGEFDDLISYLEKKAYIIWMTDDVLMRLKKEYPLINEISAKKVLNHVIAEHDANMGITWDSFDYVAKSLNIKNK